jgi:hypothetical protein
MGLTTWSTERWNRGTTILKRDFCLDKLGELGAKNDTRSKENGNLLIRDLRQSEENLPGR